MSAHVVREDDAATLQKVSTLSARQLAGQLLVVGFHGQQAPPHALAGTLERGECAGVILFRRNVGEGMAGLQQVHRLNEAIAKCCPEGLPPLLAVDEEGGRVARLGQPALKMPPMRKLAEAGGIALVQRVAHVVGRQLHALGFTMNFAPVVDVDTNPDNPIIGDRSFGRDPAHVVEFASAYCRGLRQAGIHNCLKHFPGHGDTLLDSHLALPSVDHGADRLNAVELMPFRQLVDQADSIMTAHVVFRQLFADDPEAGLPATLRRRVVTELLRRDIGFQGVVFSDDLEMNALANQGSPGQNAVASIEAGCDLLLVCSQEGMQRAVFEALREAIESRPAFAQAAQVAAARGLQLRRSHNRALLGGKELEAIVAEEIAPLQQQLSRLA